MTATGSRPLPRLSRLGGLVGSDYDVYLDDEWVGRVRAVPWPPSGPGRRSEPRWQATTSHGRGVSRPGQGPSSWRLRREAIDALIANR